MGEILLIAADWRLRALVCAQLLEGGYSVGAFPSLEIALADLIRSGEQPRLTILDTQGIELDPRALSDLGRLTAGVPLVLCGGVLSRAELSQEGMTPTQVLLRPFRVGDLVEQVRKVLECSGDNLAPEKCSFGSG